MIATHHAATANSAPLRRLSAILIALVGATFAYAVGEALGRAKAADAFMVAPGLGQLASYAAMLLALAGLTLAFEFAAPPVVSRGGRAARNLRALIRRRFRHGRTRAEIDNVEVGLTISFCAVALAAGLLLMTPKVFLVLVTAVALLTTLQAISSWCRLVGYDPVWSAAMGVLFGLGAGYLLT